MSPLTTVPNSAADLLTIVATGNGQDAIDAIEAMIAKHGRFLTEFMMRTVLGELHSESDRPPSGCRWCEISQRQHARRYVEGVGSHNWTPPTDQQIKDRMWIRRAQRMRRASARHTALLEEAAEKADAETHERGV